MTSGKTSLIVVGELSLTFEWWRYKYRIQLFSSQQHWSICSYADNLSWLNIRQTGSHVIVVKYHSNRNAQQPQWQCYTISGLTSLLCFLGCVPTHICNVSCWNLGLWRGPLIYFPSCFLIEFYIDVRSSLWNTFWMHRLFTLSHLWVCLSGVS